MRFLLNQRARNMAAGYFLFLVICILIAAVLVGITCIFYPRALMAALGAILILCALYLMAAICCTILLSAVCKRKATL